MIIKKSDHDQLCTLTDTSKRMQAHAQVDGVESSQLFKTLATFRSIEPQWLCERVSSVSDLSVMDFVTSRRFDGDAVLFLASFATQIQILIFHFILKNGFPPSFYSERWFHFAPLPAFFF